VPPEEVDSRLRDQWVSERICGPAGTVIVFDDNIVHRATLAQSAHRDVVVLQLRPAWFKGARHIDRWTGTFGDRAMSASPLDLERVPE
jgi:regulator of RNase E activity RraA